MGSHVKSSFAFLANFSHTAFTRKRRRLEEVFWRFFSHAVKCTHVPSSTFKVELSYWACLSTTLRKESHLARTAAAGLSKLLWCMLRLMVNRAFIAVLFHIDQKCRMSSVNYYFWQLTGQSSPTNWNVNIYLPFTHLRSPATAILARCNSFLSLVLSRAQ